MIVSKTCKNGYHDGILYKNKNNENIIRCKYCHSFVKETPESIKLRAAMEEGTVLMLEHSKNMVEDLTRRIKDFSDHVELKLQNQINQINQMNNEIDEMKNHIDSLNPLNY